MDTEHESTGTGHALPGLVSSEIVDFKKQNEPYIKELVQATRDILSLVVAHLYSEKAIENKRTVHQAQSLEPRGAMPTVTAGGIAR